MDVRKPNRLVKYDYSSPGYYFVTVCVEGRMSCLAECIDEEIHINSFGKIVEQVWQDTENHYDNIAVDPVHVVMPNHFHGIVIIRPRRADAIRPYGTLESVVGSFKRKTSKLIHLSDFPTFSWQKSFYDHVIREDESLDTIRQYIQNNPKQWELDEENPNKK